MYTETISRILSKSYRNKHIVRKISARIVEPTKVDKYAKKKKTDLGFCLATFSIIKNIGTGIMW